MGPSLINHANFILNILRMAIANDCIAKFLEQMMYDSKAIFRSVLNLIS